MPTGVRVITGTRPGGANPGFAPGSTFFVAGITERGPVNTPTRVRNITEYVQQFGARVTYGALFDALETYFNEGGTDAWVLRVVGTTPTLGTLTLVDRSGGAGIATVRIDAKNAGAWSANVSILVEDAPATSTVKITVLVSGVVAEVFNNLADPASIAAVLSAQSQYVNAVNLGAATAAPGNNPKVIAATALSAGTDDRSTITGATVAARAVTYFTADLGPGMVATPGYDAATVGPTLLPDSLQKNRLVALAPAAGTTVSGARTAVTALRGVAGSENAGLFYPWVQVPDSAGGLRTISPEGFVAGRRASTQVLAPEGPGQAPAGEYGIARHVVGLEVVLDKATADALNDDGINTIRVVVGAVRLYGWRSLSNDAANYRFLNARDVMNYVAGLGTVALEQFVFRTVDGRNHLLEDLRTEIRNILEPLRSAGAIYERTNPLTGEVLDPGYRIDTSSAVNPPVNIAQGNIQAVVALRPSPVGELITLVLNRVGLTQAA